MRFYSLSWIICVVLFLYFNPQCDTLPLGPLLSEQISILGIGARISQKPDPERSRNFEDMRPGPPPATTSTPSPPLPTVPILSPPAPSSTSRRNFKIKFRPLKNITEDVKVSDKIPALPNITVQNAPIIISQLTTMNPLLELQIEKTQKITESKISTTAKTNENENKSTNKLITSTPIRLLPSKNNQVPQKLKGRGINTDRKPELDVSEKPNRKIKSVTDSNSSSEEQITTSSSPSEEEVEKLFKKYKKYRKLFKQAVEKYMNSQNN